MSRLLRALAPLALLTTSGWAQAELQHYTIDPTHTYPSFEASHMNISVWRGKFDHSSGKASLDTAAGQGSVDITVDLSSVNFGMDKLDAWARSDQFFDVAKYPTATYRGQLEAFVDGVPTHVSGIFTLHGVTKPLELKINSFKCIVHPLFKRQLCGADASATFNRADFGLDAGKAYGFPMDVTLRIQVEALIDP